MLRPPSPAADSSHNEWHDARVALRYERSVRSILRQWARAAERYSCAERGVPYVASVDEHLFKAIVLKALLAMTVETPAEELHYVADDEWQALGVDAPISFERFKDVLLDLAEDWAEEFEALEFAGLLERMLSVVHRDGGFVDDSQIPRGAARPAGFYEDEDEERRAGRRLRAQALGGEMRQAAERRWVAVRFQRCVREKGVREAARLDAQAQALAADAALKDSLRDALGRNPSAAKVTVARDEALVSRLSEELRQREGREEATPAELEAAREDELRRRLTALSRRPPSDAQLASARLTELSGRLEMRLGRPPTRGEVALASDEALRWRLASSLGRSADHAELASAREAALLVRLASDLGRSPTASELEAARQAERQLREGRAAQVRRLVRASTLASRRLAAAVLREHAHKLQVHRRPARRPPTHPPPPLASIAQRLLPSSSAAALARPPPPAPARAESLRLGRDRISPLRDRISPELADAAASPVTLAARLHGR